jgi:galactofuranosylgalactofuranosylrhamnosyl-N-acetylglucosaminyl-diphospho-decaprenol beta-1,5/1,6-galactofuranosyltransferase
MHVLQRLLLPPDGLPQALYLRLRDRAGRALPVPVARDGVPLPLGDGDVLSTDSFFGSHYRAYWQRWTAVRDIAVAVRLRGRARLRVFQADGADAQLLAEVALRGEGQETAPIAFPPVALPPAPAGAGGRLHMDLAAEGPAELYGLDIVTPLAPPRQVTLSVGLVTFNQEARFARTLAALLELAESLPALRAVHVVNQGAPFADPALRAMTAHPRVRSVTQRNLGGCGGFTRTLVAALADPAPASHHLLMDDDITLDARMIGRALRFLDYAQGDIALGAGMLDALRPTVMHEAGAILRPDNVIEAHARGAVLADPAQLGHFDLPAHTDFNAWWFCILPLAACRRIGLPAPLFLRGDDFDYGARLADAGVPTVTLPGIAVWHEPFHAKPDGWQSYYDLRNRLIFAASHPGRVRQLSLAHVAGLLTTAVLTHQYAIAALRMRAVTDFLSGPAALFARDAEALQAEILALARADAPERLDDALWRDRPLAPARPRATTMRGLILQQAGALLRNGLGPLDRRGQAVLLDADAHPRNSAERAYVLTNGPRSYHLRLVPRRGRIWRLVGQAAATLWLYRRDRAAAGRTWAAGVARYHTPGWWAGVFAAPPAEPARRSPA